MPPAAPPRTAVVHDWLDTWRGGENVLAEVLRLYPKRDLFALVDFLPDALRAAHRRPARAHVVPAATSRARARISAGCCRCFRARSSRSICRLRPHRVDLARGRQGRARRAKASGTICYCLTPMRYAWDLRDAVPGVRGGSDRGAGCGRRDRCSTACATGTATRASASTHSPRSRASCASASRAATAARPTVIYPPVDTDFFHAGRRSRRRATTTSPPRDGCRTSASMPSSSAFRRMPPRRLVVAGDGPEAPRVPRGCRLERRFVGEVTRERMRDLMRGARAFVFAAEEDFGIVPVEAQACGTPVIAYGRGGALETVVADGSAPARACFSTTQTPAGIAEAVARFEAARASASTPRTAARNALHFGIARVLRRVRRLVADCLRATTARRVAIMRLMARRVLKPHARAFRSGCCACSIPLRRGADRTRRVSSRTSGGATPPIITSCSCSPARSPSPLFPRVPPV